MLARTRTYLIAALITVGVIAIIFTAIRSTQLDVAPEKNSGIRVVDGKGPRSDSIKGVSTPQVKQQAQANQEETGGGRYDSFFTETWGTAAAAPSSGINSANPQAMHARLAREPRDLQWAPKSEQALRSKFADLAALTGGNPIAVRCGSATCEVSTLINRETGSDDKSANDTLAEFTNRNSQFANSNTEFQNNSSLNIVINNKQPGKVGVVSYFLRSSR
jgi:hypothetical protein